MIVDMVDVMMRHHLALILKELDTVVAIKTLRDSYDLYGGSLVECQILRSINADSYSSISGS